MKFIRNTILLVACCAAFASPAIAEEKTESMPYLTEWAGPYKETVIYKMADYSEGVACYIYAPKSVSYAWSSGGISYGNNNIGSISCVKVTDVKSKSKK